MNHVVMFSGGIGSWATAKLVKESCVQQKDTLILLFADTFIEDEDLYRFVVEAAYNVLGGKLPPVPNIPLLESGELRERKQLLTSLAITAMRCLPGLIWTAEGRTPWEVFEASKYLGNSRIDPCSRVLKRELLRKWLATNLTPESTVVYLGFDWTEEHRYKKALRFWEPWKCLSPLLIPPLKMKEELFQDLHDANLTPPRLYAMGFSHNNCGGFCVKAGQAHFANLLKHLPCRYDYHAQKELEIQALLGKPYTILKRQVAKTTQYVSLQEFKSIAFAGKYDKDDWGGCGCFMSN